MKKTSKGQSTYLIFPLALIVLVIGMGIITSMGLQSAEKTVAYVFFLTVVGFLIMVAWSLSQRSD